MGKSTKAAPSRSNERQQLSRQRTFSNVVKGYYIVGTYGGTITSVDETVSSTTPDTTFRWDPTAQQWIFNTATGASTSLNSKNVTYLFQIVLIDGTIIGSSGTGGVI